MHTNRRSWCGCLVHLPLAVLSSYAGQRSAQVLLSGSLLAVTFGLLVTPRYSWAQTLNDPSRIEEQLPVPSEPTPPPKIEVPAREDVAPPPGAEDETFVLKTVEIEGVTVYSPQVLERFYRDYLNRPFTLQDLYAIAQQITQQYRQDGYILSLALVPAQTITEAGIVRLQVVEGYIESVEFDGAPERQLRLLKPYGDRIVASRPLNVRDLERNLLLINDLSGFEVRSVIRRGQELGAAQLVGRVTYDPLDVFFNLTNRGTEEVGPLRLQAGVIFNSPLARGEQWTLRGATTPLDISELALGSLDVDVPIGTDGLRVNAGGTFTTTRPGGDLRQFDVNGRTIRGEVGVYYPVLRSRRTTVALTGGFDYTDSLNQFPAGTLSEDRLPVLRLGLQAEKADASGIFQGSVLLSQGIGGTTPNNATLTEPISRAQGSAVFTKVNLGLTRIQRLPARFNLRLASTAQLTSDALLVPEQFGLGGNTFGSAFDPDEVLGDYGFGLRAELQRPLFYKALGFSMATQPYAFADFGKVYRLNPTAVERESDTLASTGIGIRQGFGDSLSASLELAFPLEDSTRPFRSGARLFFSITGFF